MKQFEQAWVWLKRPASIIGLAAACVVLASVLLVATLVLPDADTLGTLKDQSKEAERALESAMIRPIPEKISNEDVQALLKRLPTEERFEEFLLQLEGFEQAAGVEVTEIQIGDGSNEDAEQTGGVLLPTPESGSEGSAEQQSDPNAMVQSVTMNMNLHGTYSELTDFFRQLKQADRIFHVTNWNLSIMREDLDAMILEAWGVKEAEAPIHQMTLTLALYYAPSMNPFFPMRPLEAEQPLPKSNPTNWQRDTLELMIDELIDMQEQEQAAQEGGD